MRISTEKNFKVIFEAVVDGEKNVFVTNMVVKQKNRLLNKIKREMKWMYNTVEKVRIFEAKKVSEIRNDVPIEEYKEWIKTVDHSFR